MSLFYNRKGEPIENVIEWAKLFEDPAYQIVAVDVDVEVDDFDNMHKMVSTIWSGLESNMFETAILRDGMIEDFVRTVTEEEALHAHERACQNFLFRDAKPDSGIREEVVRRRNRG
jgi:hypothetical protein